MEEIKHNYREESEEDFEENDGGQEQPDEEEGDHFAEEDECESDIDGGGKEEEKEAVEEARYPKKRVMIRVYREGMTRVAPPNPPVAAMASYNDDNHHCPILCSRPVGNPLQSDKDSHYRPSICRRQFGVPLVSNNNSTKSLYPTTLYSKLVDVPSASNSFNHHPIGFCPRVVGVRSASSKSSDNNGDLCCQVDGCGVDLTIAKRYHRRHRVCESHAKATVVSVNSIDMRFCQQCSRYCSVCVSSDTPELFCFSMQLHVISRDQKLGAGFTEYMSLMDPKEVVGNDWLVIINAAESPTRHTSRGFA
ncbi:hypothetical protein RJ639_008051 [Escallonia herrerae]|uniref:SBP-type domain-containing protein n=1 Tax=Escallonia herrerae TaxID=1293975 RepID=A0AA89ASZ8_9ASTE|nr:hypothetical protein RJ639_008051 [Escallonia herrerae]